MQYCGSNPHTTNPKKKKEEVRNMNSENQTLIILIFGASLIITIIGTLLLTVRGTSTETTAIFIGIITTIVGILATFLQGKTMTEKQEEILTQQTIQGEVDDVQ